VRARAQGQVSPGLVDRVKTPQLRERLKEACQIPERDKGFGGGARSNAEEEPASENLWGDATHSGGRDRRQERRRTEVSGAS